MHRVERARLPSVLLALQELLNSVAVGDYRCVHANVEAGQAGREDPRRAMRTILGEPASRARFALRDDFVDELRLDILDRFGPDGALKEILSRWAQADPRPLVLLIDEIDTLLSVLRQLRAGYARRAFPRAPSCAAFATCGTTASTRAP